jgi:hypothetical protein
MWKLQGKAEAFPHKKRQSRKTRRQFKLTYYRWKNPPANERPVGVH